MALSLQDYRRLPYERIWETRVEASGAYFLVRLKDLPMVAADGVSKMEALANLRVAFDEFVEWALDAGVELPAPSRVVSSAPYPSRRTWEVVPSVAKTRVETSPVALPISEATRVGEPSVERRFSVACV